MYEFYGHLIVVEEVCSLEDDPKRAFPYLFADSIMNTNNVRRR